MSVVMVPPTPPSPCCVTHRSSLGRSRRSGRTFPVLGGGVR
ncbi:hypothetical protein HMPREF9344_01108 [Cutibacterium acnes HL097PA1]|nr:hypothetical protein HMPREF9344_01108 [Cutibacterium acnes HL097PA1]